MAQTLRSINNEQPFREASLLKGTLRHLVRSLYMAKLKMRLRSKLKVGENVNFGPKADLRPAEFIKIGNNFSTGKELIIESNIVAGNDILISSRVSFVGNDHRHDDPERSVYWSGRLPDSTVYMEGDNLIGFGVTIVGNVRIGKGCIIGAGAVVTRDLPPNSVCVGVPAKPIKQRHCDVA